MSTKTLMWLGCGIMVLGGAYFLWTNGNQNILGYAMLLLCPLMHLLMHRGHKGQDAGKDDGPESDRKPACH
ncbi:MAG TPA: DUF2933 domain-containing protein [Symbiobacteriaceae bacterium]|nr:DUF2933 domain-containing protein [Symbiobacteriaceae bacterium]